MATAPKKTDPDLEDTTPEEDLEASRAYKPAERQDYGQSEIGDFDKRLAEARGATPEAAKTGQKLEQSPVVTKPAENGRQDLEKLMNDYESAVKTSADRQRNKGLIATGINLSVPGAGNDFLKSMQGYIDEPTNAVLGRIKAGQEGANLNKSVSSQFATDEDNDPNSGSSLLARHIGVKYGIIDPEDKTTTAAQIKRVAPFVTAEMKGQQSQQVTDTKEKGSTERKAMDIAGAKDREEMKATLQKTLHGMDNATKMKVAEMLIKGGFDKMVVQEVLQMDQKLVTGANKGMSPAAQAREDRSLSGNAFASGPGDEMWHLKPGHPPPSVAEANKLTEVRDWSKIIDMYANLLGQAARKVRSGQDPINEYAKLQSLSSGANQALVKGWLNGVANGKDVENAQAQMGDYGSFLKFISGYSEAKTRALKESNKQKYFSYMSTDFELGPADRSLVTKPGGGGSGGGSITGSAGPMKDASGAANQILGNYGYGPVSDVSRPAGAAGSVAPAAPSAPQYEVGKVYQTSKGSLKFLGRNPQTGKNQWGNP